MLGLALTVAQAVSAGGCTLPVQGELSQQCTSDEACEDGNVCTDPLCSPEGMCEFVPLPDGPTGEQEAGDCLRVECQAGQLAEVLDLTDTLNDYNACTNDICDPAGAGPISTPLPYETPCEEGGGIGQCGCLHGEVVEACLPNETPECQIGCTPETADEVCDDDNPCTDDSCNASTSLCARQQLDGVPAPDEEQVPGDCRIILCAAGVPSEPPGEMDNADLPVDGNGCTRDICTDGEPTNPPEDLDFECTDDGGHFCDGNGACVECNDHTQCGDTAANCLCRQCQDHACVNLASGTDAPNCQAPNDCQILECNGAGSYTSVDDNLDLPVSDNNVCTDDLCTAGAVEYRNNTVACNDDVYCNGTDTCSGGSCGVHTGDPCAVNLGDNDSDCTEACNEATNDCTANDASNSVCNDGAYCTVTDRCNSSGSCVGTGNPCPGADGDGNCSESCNEGADDCTAADPNGVACTDGTYCNGTDSCSGGTCGTHQGDPCPGADGDSDCSEMCNEATDDCSTADPNGSACSDGTYCNGTETCTGGACGGSTGNPCPGVDGDNDCSEMCNEGSDNCTSNDANGSACSDGAYCNGTETCTTGVCGSSTGDPCGPASDANCAACNEGSDNCTATEPNGSACSDGTYCNGTETCTTGVCGGSTGDPCGPASDANCAACNETSDNCSAAEPNGSACSDGNYCTGTETCTGGACGGSTGDPCGPVSDSNCAACSETNDNCSATEPNGSACSDGTYCNGTETCSGGACGSSTGDPCGPVSDSNCAACSETSDNCSATEPNGSACSDGTYCNGTETCNGGACGSSSGDPCGPVSDSNCAACNETSDNCSSTEPNGSACSDGAYCNGTETCTGGACGSSSGDPCGPVSDDNCAACNETSDNCSSTEPNGSACSDGTYCNGTETCSGGACGSSTGDPCGPVDDDNCAACNETSDNCSSTEPNGSACSDGTYCNGTETCSGGACAGSTGDPCAASYGDANCTGGCNEGSDNCTSSEPDDSACDDSTYCNGADTCQTGACTPSGVNPCAALLAACTNSDSIDHCHEGCEESNDSCTANSPSGTVCHFGATCNDLCDANGTCVQQ